MEIPEWLKSQPVAVQSSSTLHPARAQTGSFRKERFLDATLGRIISFLEDTMFNERTSNRNGLLQKIEPRMKVVTVILFIILLSLQKAMGGIAIFFLLAVLLGIASKLPLLSFLKRLMPAAIITFLISLPVLLNVVVDGQPLLVLLTFKERMRLGPVVTPVEIAITSQGVKSAVTLFLRVVSSVSLVFLITMTTPPHAFVKSLSSLVPGPLKSVVSISYRYIFFLVRKVEQFVMGLRSRQIAVVSNTKGRHWVASRIGLLFSISMEFSNELAMAMESRGCGDEGFRAQSSKFEMRKLSLPDKAWLIFTVLFTGIMIWKSFA